MGFRGGWIQERCNRRPNFGSGHTPARGKAKGAGGLDTKSMESCIKIFTVIRQVLAWHQLTVYGPKN